MKILGILFIAPFAIIGLAAFLAENPEKLVNEEFKKDAMVSTFLSMMIWLFILGICLLII